MGRERIKTVLSRGLLLASLIVAVGPSLSRGQTVAQISQQSANARDNGDFAEALRLARQGIALSEASGNQSEIAYWENEIGFDCIQLGRHKEAEAALKRAIELQTRISGNDSDQVLLYRGNLAALYFHQSRYDEAETLMRSLVSVQKKKFGIDTSSLASNLVNLAAILNVRGRYTDAETCSNQALEIYKKNNVDPGDLKIAGALQALGDSYFFQGRNEEAFKTHGHVLRIREARLWPGHTLIGVSLVSVAQDYSTQGKIVDAVPLLKRAIEIFQKNLGPDKPDTLTTMDILANAYRLDARFAEAEALFNRAKAARQKTGALTRDYAIEVYNQALLYSDQKRYAEAEAGFREAIQVMERILGQDHLETALARNRLSLVLSQENKTAEAEALANRALAILEKPDGSGHANTSEVYENLAKIAERTGDLDKALKLLTRSIASLERPGVSPSTLFVFYHYRSIIFWKMGRRHEAMADLKKALELAEQRRALSAGTVRDRADRYAEFGRAFERMVEWQVTLGHPDEAFQAIERFRARSFLDEMALVGVVTHATRAPTRDEMQDYLRDEEWYKAMVSSYEKRREELLKTTAPDDFAVKSNDEQLANTRKQMEAHERKMQGLTEAKNQATPAIFAAVPTPAEFIGKIGSKILLLDYLIGEDGGYVVVVGSGSTRVVPLVVAAAEAKVLGIDPGPLTDRRLKDSLIGAKGDGVLSQLANPATSEKVSAKLSVLWRVLIPEVDRQALVSGKFDDLIIAPDGSLTLLPFEALVVEDGPEPAYLLDAGPAIAYAPSAAVLSKLASRTDAPSRNQAEPILTLGNPSYPSAAVAPPMKPSDELAPKYQLRATGIKFNPLPFTAWETTWVAQAFGERGRPALSLSGSTATESAVRLNVPGRRIIHLACHGITEQTYGNSIGALVMTPGPKGDADPADDGFLTLPEIYGLDLKGCELAILSACQTNIGPQQKGEGNWTLSRGFLVAGARRVVASDWLVDDQAAANLVSIFSSTLANREQDGARVDHAQALQDAKRWVRKQEKWKAPYFWASMVLVGPPQNLTKSRPDLPPGQNVGPATN